MIIEHRTYLDNSEEFYFFNSPKLKTTEDVKQLYKLRSPEYITHTPAKLYGRDEYNYYASEFIETPYDPEDGLIYPEHFKPTREEFRTELIRLGIIFDNTEHTDIKTAFRTATATANNFKAWRELKFGKDGE